MGMLLYISLPGILVHLLAFAQLSRKGTIGFTFVISIIGRYIVIFNKRSAK